MTQPNLRDVLQRLLSGDATLAQQLREAGHLPNADEELTPEQLETARVARTLIHELELNWAGVEVALHLREELRATRRQVAELAMIVREQGLQPRK